MRGLESWKECLRPPVVMDLGMDGLLDAYEASQMRERYEHATWNRY